MQRYYVIHCDTMWCCDASFLPRPRGTRPGTSEGSPRPKLDSLGLPDSEHRPQSPGLSQTLPRIGWTDVGMLGCWPDDVCCWECWVWVSLSFGIVGWSFNGKIAKVEQSFDLVSICHVGAVWLGPSFVTFSWQEIVQRRRWQLSKPLIVANLAQVPSIDVLYDDWIWSIEFWSLSHANGQVGPKRFVQGWRFHEHVNVFGRIDTWRPSTSGGCRSNASSPLPSPRPPSSPLLVLTDFGVAYPLK